jgi:crotonobetainyl-CoA:carnitine CoA-transferase CaiB-like acyl-CoA transferase
MGQEAPPVLLEGVKVIEMSTWVAGPSAAAVLAEWGADVVKVEAPGGDATRALAPDTSESPGNPIFTNENRGKRGIVLDMRQPGGREVLLTLLGQADIFITNLRPASLARLSLDYDSLRPDLPRLIYGIVTSYGLAGADAGSPAFDTVAFWTASGAGRATIPDGQEPFSCRPGFGDHFTAMSTVAGLLAALHERAGTGRGRLVEASLIRAGTFAVGWDMGRQLRYGEAVTNVPREQSVSAVSGYFRAGDGGWVYSVCRSAADFRALVAALDAAELDAEDPFGAGAGDPAEVARLRGLIEGAFARFTQAEICGRLKSRGLMHAPLRSLAEAAASDTARDAGCFQEVGDGWGGSFLTTAAPIRFPDGAPATGRAAPKLGEHTREILREAGYPPAAIEELLEGGTAG